MRPALSFLFDFGEAETLRLAIRSPEELGQVRAAIEAELAPTGPSPVPPGDRGDNLILALVALRLKFPRSEAEEKLEKNLALRRGH